MNLLCLFPAKAASAGPEGPPQLGRVHSVHQPLETTGGTSLQGRPAIIKSQLKMINYI